MVFAHIRPAVGEEFVGRKDMIKFFEEELKQEEHQGYLILGIRGIGKTSLLKKFKEIADKNNCKTIYITKTEVEIEDIGDEEIRQYEFFEGTSSLLCAIKVLKPIRKIREKAEAMLDVMAGLIKTAGELMGGSLEEGIKSLGLTLDTIGIKMAESKIPLTPVEFIELMELVDEKIKYKMVILIDSLEEYSLYDKQILTKIATHRYKNIIFLLTRRSDDKIKDELYNEREVYPFVNSRRVLEIKGLSPDDCKELLRKNGIEFDEEAFWKMERVLRGHPYYYRILIYILKSKYGGRLDEKIVEEIKLENEADKMNHLLYESLHNFKDIMKAMSVLNFIDESILSCVVGRGIKEQINELGRRGLVEVTRNTINFSHALFGEHIKNVELSEEERKVIHKKAMQCFRNKKYDGIHYLHSYAYHAENCEEYKEAMESYRELAIVLRDIYGEAIKFWLKVYMMAGKMKNNEFLIEAIQELLFYGIFISFPELEDIRQNAQRIVKRIDNEKKAPLLYYLAMIHHAKGNYDEALELCNESLKIFEELGDKGGIASTLHQIAMIYEDKGNYDKALELYNKSLKIEEELEDKRGIAETLHQIAMIYQHKGNYDKALELYNKSLKIKEELEDKRGIASTLHQIAMIYQHKGNYDKALELYNKSLKISEELEDKRGIAYTLAQMGLLFTSSQPLKALFLLTQANKIFREMGLKAEYERSLRQIKGVISSLKKVDEKEKLHEIIKYFEEVDEKIARQLKSLEKL